MLLNTSVSSSGSTFSSSTRKLLRKGIGHLQKKPPLEVPKYREAKLATSHKPAPKKSPTGAATAGCSAPSQ